MGGQPIPIPDQVGNGVPVEHGKEGFESLGQCDPESAIGMQGAGVGFWIEAFDQGYVPLGLTNDIAKTNRLRRPCQPNPPFPSPNSLKMAETTQLRRRLFQVIVRYAVSPRDLRQGAEGAPFQPGIHQNADGKI